MDVASSALWEFGQLGIGIGLFTNTGSYLYPKLKRFVLWLSFRCNRGFAKDCKAMVLRAF